MSYIVLISFIYNVKCLVTVATLLTFMTEAKYDGHVCDSDL